MQSYIKVFNFFFVSIVLVPFTILLMSLFVGELDTTLESSVLE